MSKVIKCPCGMVVRARDEDSLVTQAQKHARDAHAMELTREQVLAMAVPNDDEEETMDKYLRCGDLFPGCGIVAHGESEEEILKQAAEHAKRDHGVSQIDAATLAKVKAAIRSS